MFSHEIQKPKGLSKFYEENIDGIYIIAIIFISLFMLSMIVKALKFYL